MRAFVRRRYSKLDVTGKRRLLGFEVEWIDNEGKRRRKLHQKQRDATAERDKHNAPRQSKSAAQGPAPAHELEAKTIRIAGKEWLARVVADGAARVTWKKYEQRLRDHVYPVKVALGDGEPEVAFGDVAIGMVSTPLVLRFKAALQVNRSAKLVKKVMGIVRMLFNDAELAGTVSNNAARAVRMRRGRKVVEPPVVIPEPSQVRLLLAAVQLTEAPPTFGQVWVPLLPTTGMRPQESRALFWNFVFSAAREPFVRIAFAADDENRIKTPKSQAGYRDIPISRGMALLLDRWREVCPPSPGFKEHGGLVFPTADGHVQTYPNLTKRIWRPLMRHVGLTRPTGKLGKDNEPLLEMAFTPYSLRHFYASYLIQERGKNPKQVQRLMGHERIELTLQTYGHLWKDQQDDAVLAESLGAFLEPTAADLARVQLRLAKTA